MTPLIEPDCTITHNGATFASGGAVLAPCTDGYWRGVVYQGTDSGTVRTWHGDKLAFASYGRPYQGNFCRMRSVTFTLGGITFHGRWCPDWADMIRVRSTRKVA